MCDAVTVTDVDIEAAQPPQDDPADSVDATSHDVVIVGAGFSGLYALFRLKEKGLSAIVLEAADDVGGTWYWNRYPGARCDVESVEYSYSFSPELDQEWTWSERYASQPEILRYLNHVADRFDLRPNIVFNTRVEAAAYDERLGKWTVTTETGRQVTARFCIMATGGLSAPISPPFEGADTFDGLSLMTSTWPKEGVDLTGKRVAVIGTGSSGIQAVPEIAGHAARVSVFQRSPNYSIPGRNRKLTAQEVAEQKATYPDRRERQRFSFTGTTIELNMRRGRDLTPAEQQAELDRRWEAGGALDFTAAFRDVLTDMATNKVVQDYLSAKIRERAQGSGLADLVTPKQPFGVKRPCVDHGYYETLALDHVDLVDVGKDPIAAITPTGVKLASGVEHDADAIVYAIGYDAISGALARIDIRGKDGRTLREEWAAGPETYLGLAVAGFPNMFLVAGPGSALGVTMMIPLIEQNVEWITDLIAPIARHDIAVEATRSAQDAWTRQVDEGAKRSVFSASTNSYYWGANVPGKPRRLSIYLGGFLRYRTECDRIAAGGYDGFTMQPTRVAVH